MSTWGLGGQPLGRGGTPLGSPGSGVVVVPPPPPPPPPSSWPPQDIKGKKSITINSLLGPQYDTPDERWRNAADAFYAALDTAGATSEWYGARLQADATGIQATPGASLRFSISPDDLEDKVAWLYAHGIRPFFLFTFAPWHMTIHPQRTVDITNVGGRARLSGGTLASNENWLNIAVTAPGILPSGTYVGGSPSDDGNLGNGDPFVMCDHAALVTGTGKTVTFGGASGHQAFDTNHLGIADDQMVNYAYLAVSLIKHFAAQAPRASLKPGIISWNEANGDHGYRPHQDVARYCDTFRHIYRAVMEYDPSTPVIFTGLSNNTKTSQSQRSLDFVLFMEAALRYMHADTTWSAWRDATTPLIPNAGNLGLFNHTMADLKAAGTLSPHFYVSYMGWDPYGFGRPGWSTKPAEGTINFYTWLRATADDDGGPFNTSARFVRALNKLHDLDVEWGGGTGLDKLRFFFGEFGAAEHPAARTGIGAELARVGVDQQQTNSGEEAYAHDTIAWQRICANKRWPSGGQIPVYRGPGRVEDRIAVGNRQRLQEVTESYQGADTFANTGYYALADAPGPPAVSAHTIKRNSGTSRPYVNSGAYSVANIGAGNDAFEAFAKHWDPT